MDFVFLKMPLKVLLISDSLTEANRIQQYLQESELKHHFTLHQQYTFSGGIKAIALLKIDIVLLDHNISDLLSKPFDGLTQLIQDYPNIPVIYLINRSEIDLVQEIIYLGAQTCVFKELISSTLLIYVICWSLERKNLFGKLADANKQLGMGYWEIDTKHNRWQGSPALDSILEKKIDTLENFLQLVHPEDQRRVALAFMQAIREGQPFELEHRLDLGTPPKRVLIQGMPDLDADQQVIRIRGEIKNIHTASTPTSFTQRPVIPHAAQQPVAQQREERYSNIDYLKQVSGGDAMIMKKAIGKFIETTPEMVAQMEQYLSREDYEELAKSAHKLKSSVAMMGMDEILKTIKNIELVAKNQERIDVLPVLINRTKKMLFSSFDELKQEITALQ